MITASVTVKIEVTATKPPPQPKDVTTTPFDGVQRISGVRYGWRWELFKVDPSKVRYEAVCTPSLETVSSVATRKGAQIAGNGSDWNRTSLYDYAVSNGAICHERTAARPSLMILSNGLPVIDYKTITGVQHAITGLRPLIENGIIDPDLYKTTDAKWTEGHARSIHALDANGNHLWMVSEGITPNQGLKLWQCAELMKQHDAVKCFDSGGGGDAEIWLDGVILTKTENPGGAERALPQTLLLYANPISPKPPPLPGGIVHPPAGYHIEQVRRWGYGDDDQNLFVAQGDFSTSIRLVNGVEVGQFMVVNTLVYGKDPDDTDPRWIGNLSAISNFSRLNHSDVMWLARAQIIPFAEYLGKNEAEIWAMSDADLIKIKDVVLPDGYTLHLKMRWLINAGWNGSGKPNNVMWGYSPDGQWYNATEVRYGSMVNGGQLVAVSDEVFQLNIQLQNMTSRQDVPCRKLLPFRRSHWGLSHATHPYLLQYATVANKGDKYGEDMRGKIMCPIVLASEFDFASNFTPEFYALPVNWTVSI